MSRQETTQLASKIVTALAQASHSRRKLGVDVDGLDCSMVAGMTKGSWSVVICADGNVNKARVESMGAWFAEVNPEITRLAHFEDDDCADGVQTMLWLDLEAAGRILGSHA